MAAFAISAGIIELSIEVTFYLALFNVYFGIFEIFGDSPEFLDI